jgi:hypothetical protein
MTAWKPTPRAPAKTKEELREIAIAKTRIVFPKFFPPPVGQG